MPPPGSARNNVIWFGPVTMAVTGAPGLVLPSETLVHGRHPVSALPDVVYTPPAESARNNVTRFGAATTAVTGAPGVLIPSETLVHRGSPDGPSFVMTFCVI